MNRTHPPARSDSGPDGEHELFRPAAMSGETADDSDTSFAVIDRLVRPTWSEVEGAREEYARAAKRLRRWQVWFIAMFTVYTTLSGILLLSLFLRG
jgi:hypothetical protein